MTCQIVDSSLEPACTFTDSGGVRCENPEPDHRHQHWISEHTNRHALAGNGYDCAAIGNDKAHDNNTTRGSGDMTFKTILDKILETPEEEVARLASAPKGSNSH